MFVDLLTLLTYPRRKDVTLPSSMQRSMAAEAEADREAKAKVRVHIVYYP